MNRWAAVCGRIVDIDGLCEKCLMQENWEMRRSRQLPALGRFAAPTAAVSPAGIAVCHREIPQ